MSDDTTNYESAQKFAGRVILVGIICLFLAMAFGLADIALIANPGGGRLFKTLANVFGFLWLPIVGVGILMRMTNTKPESQSSSVQDSQNGT